MDLLDKIDEVTEVTISGDEVKQYAKEIMKKYRCTKILGMLDDRIIDYVDPDWEEDGEYDSEYDWYQDFGRGEAELDIIEELVRQLEKKKRVKFNIDSFIAIGESIADKCGISY
jgi:hypothetical protein